jgi:hypothetical protein
VRFESEDSASLPVEPPAAEEPVETGSSHPGSLRKAVSSWPAIIVGAIVTVGGYVLAQRVAPCPDFYDGTAYAGSNTRLQAWIGGCGTDLGAARRALITDYLFIAGYLILGTALITRWWPLYRARPLQRLGRWIVFLPLAAATFDAVENVLVLAMLGEDGSRYTYPTDWFGPTLIALFAWLKVLAWGATILCAVAVVLLAIARRNRVAPAEPYPSLSAAAPIVPVDEGVCCSGGGIRAAAFALGAIAELESGDVIQRARWLTAVSGGNYAATAWTLARGNDPERPAAEDLISWVRSPITQSQSPQHRFLSNGPGGLPRAVLAAVVYVAFNLFFLALLVAVIAWPVGRLVGSKAIQPRLHTLHGIPPDVISGRELWMPGVLLLAVAGAVLLIAGMKSWSTSRLWRLAVAIAAVALVMLLLTVGIPEAMEFVADRTRRSERGVRASATSLAAVLAGLGTAWRLARKQVASRLTPKLPYLGGLLLAIAAIAWAGRVATDAATGTGLMPETRHWVVAVALFAAVYLGAAIHRWSLHELYRKRLRRTFGVARDDETGELCSPAQRRQVTWDKLPGLHPELVVCCAHQRNGIAPGGLPADTFTISRNEVRVGDHVVPTSAFLARLTAANKLSTELAVSSWMATSGAAIASAMGRMSRGSTNALLAAFNIDLGVWLPNPQLLNDPPSEFGKVRFGYLLKEILGWYAEDDRYVFVADGGHWDNLGLVELLRRRCKTIICLDASGDEPGKFTTLHQAVELAGFELPTVVASIDLKPLAGLTGEGGALPACSVTELKVSYAARRHDAETNAAVPGSTGTILYAKEDPSFPNYSTARQFLNAKQFDNLIELGRAAGKRLKVLYEEVTAPAPEPEPVVAAAAIIEPAAAVVAPG